MPARKSVKKIKVFGNQDKDGKHKERWTKGRDILNFPSPYRMILLGSPSTGKSNFMKGVICEAKPRFKEFYLIHHDTNTHEWDDIDWTYKSNVIPNSNMFHGKTKKLLILEDLPLRSLDRKTLARLGRIFGVSSSHHNLTVFISSQDLMGVPPAARRCASVMYLTKTPDISSVGTLASKAGFKPEHLHYLYNKYIIDDFSSLLIDLTPKTPAPLRSDGYNLINFDKVRGVIQGTGSDSDSDSEIY